ncbi:MAG: response regulator [Proteobacteria bacterium]|nr:MAG: response regulator [Pseudomonadota bacterium]
MYIHESRSDSCFKEACDMERDNISVLVVDDEPVLRELVSFILNDKGFHVTTAESGDAAFKMVLEKHYDVIVSDVRMPNGSGIDLLNKLNTLPQRPAVFLVSGYSEISLEDARKLGAKDLLNKPVDYDSLCNAIYNTYLSGKKMATPG